MRRAWNATAEKTRAGSEKPITPRLNRNSSAHLDELTLKGLLSILIKSQTRPIKAKLCNLTQLIINR